MTIEKMFELDTPLTTYLKSYGLTPKDFYCRECGKLMVDMNQVEEVLSDLTLKKSERLGHLILCNKRAAFAENEQNRWLINGRTLSGKVFFRHICWDCFFKHLREVEDIAKRARKSSWYKDINNGIIRPPAACSSPSKYFKLLFDITDEELEKEHQKFDTASLDAFIRRHGEEEGRRKYEEYKNRQAYTCSLEYFQKEKGMTEEQWKEYNNKRACTKENFIKRYGKEDGTRKWDAYCDKEAYVGCKLEYFIDKYGEEKGKLFYAELSKMKAHTIEYYIKKYGEEEGRKRFKETQKHFSNIGNIFFDSIKNSLGDFGNNAKYGEHEQQMYIECPDGSNKICYPDFLLNTKVIEFNGDYWHMNPKLYSPDTLAKFMGESSTAEDVWKRDKDRLDGIKKLGYQVKVVWENDYISDPDKVIQECVDFLKGDIRG